MQVSIRVVGFVAALRGLVGIADGARAVEGQIAAFGSRLPYASFIETGRSRRPQVRRAGPARMFEMGRADARKLARDILPGAVVNGTRSVGQAKRRIRDYGIERIRLYTPVRSGKLRDSVQELSRPS